MADDGGCYVNKEKWITEKEWKLLKEVWLDWRRNGDWKQVVSLSFWYIYFNHFSNTISAGISLDDLCYLKEMQADLQYSLCAERIYILILQRFNVFVLEFSKLVLSVQIIFYEEQLGQSYVCYTVICI